MLAHLPEVAQRYFARAIAPGTPLFRTVRLEMQGSFILNGTPFLTKPDGFADALHRFATSLRND